ncbi:MAG: hypothetical protein LBB72_03415 [Spirochaetaceae bacterium]|jgi:hypothetical protein|nr:hypothetical protein [Spirochaetaceae bacterium]
MKKVLFVVVLAMIIAGGVFAQARRGAPAAAKNWISGEVGLLGAGSRYERMLSSNLSIGANVYWNSLFFFWNEFAVDGSFRFYPVQASWGGFFVGGALGFHIHTGTYQYEYDSIWVSGGRATGTWFGSVFGVAITPEVGWKIDVGAKNKFFLSPGLKLPVTFGMLRPYLGLSKKEFKVGFGVVPYFGMGYAF